MNCFGKISSVWLITTLLLVSACNAPGSGVEAFVAATPASVSVTTTTAATPSPTPNYTVSQPILITASSYIAFANTATGASSTQLISVFNVGSIEAQIGTLNFTASTGAANILSVSGDTCSSSILLVGQSCSFTAQIAPVAAGSYSGYLKIPYSNLHNATSTFTREVPYTAVASTPVAVLASSPTTFDFGSVQIGANLSHSFIISNTASGGATFQATTISGSGLSITADTCSGITNMVSGGSTCTVTVKFQPTASGNIISAFTLNYQNSAGTAFTKTVALTAIGAAAQPTLTLSPSPYNFGNVPTNTNATQTISVSNASLANATIGTLTISGTGYTIASQTCNSTVLVSGAACQAILRFTPTTTGVASGTFTVPYTAADGTAYTATDTLGGTGTTPATSFTFAGVSGSSSLTPTGVTATWSAQSLASYYIIRWTTGGTTVTTPHIAPTTLSSYNITGLTPNTTYTIQMNAYDSIDSSDGNVATISVTTPNVTGATFNGWSDVVGLGKVYTDIGTIDTSLGTTGNNRIERNLAAVAGFSSTDINTGTNIITSLTTFATGTSVTFSSDGTAPTGLTIGNTYYVINVSSTTMKLATSSANATAETAIALTAAGSGNMTLMPNAVIRLGWDLFTFTPTSTATAYNIYRDTTGAFTSPTLVGTSSTNSFSDWSPVGQTTYYYKVKPVISGTEVEPTAVNDSIIQVYAPPQNMALLHRWAVNREACTTLLGVTYSTGVNRNTNYSCSYSWGGSGGSAYGANSLYDKTKWDLGYSLVVDRWQNGCKMKSYGSAAPSGGSTNDVYLKTGNGSLSNIGPATCYIKDASSGWIAETSSLTSAERGLMHTNYPGYQTTGATQSQAYNTCQQRTYTGIVDGNGNTTLRLPRLHEMVLAKAVQGINVNYRAPATLSSIFSGSNLPVNGSCNTVLNNSGGNMTALDSVSLPNPSTYALTPSSLMNGSYLSKNCYSRYEISNLWDSNMEWLSTQYYAPSASGGYFTASILDPNDNLLEGYLMNGSVGPSQVFNNYTNGTFFGNTATTITVLPLFGVQATAVSSSLGSRSITNSTLDYGVAPGAVYTLIGKDGIFNHGIITGGMGTGWSLATRYSFGTNPTSYSTNTFQQGMNPVGERCTGQVGP